MRGADLGLLLYDPTRYYARCSGVLLEMQCAGVPVLVPAGSWLASQIEPLNQPWLDQLAARLGAHTPAATDAGDVHAVAATSTRIDVPAGTRSLLLAFQWEQPALPGRYLEVTLHALDAASPVQRRIVSARDGNAPVRLLFALPAAAAQSWRLELTAAWQPGAAPPARLAGWQVAAERLPAGFVGLTLSDASQLAASVEELLQHHAHYRAGARSQAAACGYRQDPPQVLVGLVGAGPVTMG